METTTYVDERLQRLNARLQLLELHAATTGIDTPPHVLIEIDDIRDEIELIQVSNNSLISLELLKRMEEPERWKRLYDSIWEVQQIIYTIKKNAESDRIRTQNRHTDFNKSIQRITFENELLKHNQRRIFLILVLFGIFAIVALITIARMI